MSHLANLLCYQPLQYLPCAYSSVVLVLDKDRQNCYMNHDARLATSWYLKV